MGQEQGTQEFTICSKGDDVRCLEILSGLGFWHTHLFKQVTIKLLIFEWRHGLG